jgi:Organic solute transporter Ostalpha
MLSQEFLICIEMFVAALAHAYAFPPSDYTDPLHPPQGMVSTHVVNSRVDAASGSTHI